MLSYDEYKKLIDDNLLNYLPGASQYSSVLIESMRYSLSVGGKRLRPVLLLAACDAAGGNIYDAIPHACALEYIHTYSLIHDDLPAMDDDDMRRGKPSNHKVYGEDIAILAGDALLNTASEIMLKAALDKEQSPECFELYIKASYEIVQRSGASGMIAGQTADVTSETSAADDNLVSYIELHKTADLIIAPIRAGLIIANADESVIKQYTLYAQNIGTAFQIIDDLLDIKGSTELIGKTLGKDIDQGKCNFALLHGTEFAESEIHRLSREAKSYISNLDGFEFFASLTDELESRNM